MKKVLFALFSIVIINLTQSGYGSLSSEFNSTFLSNNAKIDCRDFSKIYEEMNKENTTQQDIEFLTLLIEFSCTPEQPNAVVTGCAEKTGFSNVNFTGIAKEEKHSWVSIVENCVEDTTELTLTKSEYNKLVHDISESSQRSEFLSYVALLITIIGVIASYPVVSYIRKKFSQKKAD